jgi:hypothetical protein
MAQSINIKLDIGQCVKDAATEIWKWGEVNKDDANYQRIYHMQYGSDPNDTDKKLLKGYVLQRVQRIADFVSEYLTDIVYGEDTISHTNIHPSSPFLPPQRGTEPDYVEYTLLLPGGWNGKTFPSLCQHFNDYVAEGAAADWFTNIGEKQGAVFEQQATVASTNIIRNIYRKNSTI